MIAFLVSICLLVAGYFTYGRFVERYFGVSAERDTPVKRLADGVDYQELKPWRMYVIQFLNIAGLGPIFGAIMGAAYGPMAYLWIVVGCIFMGAAHDFFSGMLSLRNDGKDLPEIVGTYLGKRMRQVLIVFAAFLLLAVGVSFVNGPAELLARLTGWDMTLWLWVIFAYYVFATLLPIDKIIGKVYPFMGGALLFMALGVGAYLIYGDATGAVEMKELTADSLRNFHSNPDANILFPMLFVVISCGAISGFHATQSPLMARCMANEKYARPVFYGAMVSEGVVALIWATAAIAYFGGPEGLNVGRHGVPQHASYRGAGVPLQPEEAGQPPDGVGADFCGGLCVLLYGFLDDMEICGHLQSDSCHGDALDGGGIPCAQRQGALDYDGAGDVSHRCVCLLSVCGSVQGWRTGDAAGCWQRCRHCGGVCAVGVVPLQNAPSLNQRRREWRL